LFQAVLNNQQIAENMKHLAVIVYGLFLSGFSSAQDWKPEWYQTADLNALSKREISRMIAGRYTSEYFILGWSEMNTVTNYALSISRNGKLIVYSITDTAKENRAEIFECYLRLHNDQGILTVETYSIKNTSELKPLDTGIFSGMLYIGTKRDEIMFGNGIEIDGGPATVWRKDNK
jgi:hypothetical protein